MTRDLIFLYFSVPLAILGGLASLWLTFELVEIAGAELMTIAFGGLSIFLFLAAIMLGIIAVSELVRSN